jgi:hypothetical protein
MTPTHSGTDLGWIARHAFRRSVWTALAIMAATLAAVLLLLAPGPSAQCVGLAHLTQGPDLRVTAVPGVDLRPVLDAPGLSASSGPYPGVASSMQHGGTEISTWLEGRPARAAAVDRPQLVSGSWPRRGGVVVEQGLARRLALRPGSHARVATTRGLRSLRVTGVAATSSVTRTAGTPGLAYVLPHELRKVAPAPVQGSTVLLRVDGNPGALAGVLERRYAGPQAVISRSFADHCLAR